MNFYHCCPILLETNSIILPGNWGRSIERYGFRHNCWTRETNLEYIRQQYYPDKPSRLHGIFCMDSLDTARYYQQTINPDNLLYEVMIVNPKAPTHIGNFACVEPLQNRLEKSFPEVAHHYWNADWWVPLSAAPHIKTSEILTTSPRRIIQML